MVKSDTVLNSKYTSLFRVRIGPLLSKLEVRLLAAPQSLEVLLGFTWVASAPSFHLVPEHGHLGRPPAVVSTLSMSLLTWEFFVTWIREFETLPWESV